MKRNSFTKEQIGKLRRLERAKQIMAQGNVFPVAGAAEKFVVFSSAGNKLYLVDLAEQYCTCPDFQTHQEFNGGWCKHRMAAWLLKEHPDDYQDWLPPWAKGDGQAQGNGKGKGDDKLFKALSDLPDAALARIVALASQVQMDRDYERAVSKDA
ncbi:MAG: SWIM zinc finger family protein [Candidatus Bipolaricaulia bacterium]